VPLGSICAAAGDAEGAGTLVEVDRIAQCLQGAHHLPGVVGEEDAGEFGFLLGERGQGRRRRLGDAFGAGDVDGGVEGALDEVNVDGVHEGSFAEAFDRMGTR